MTRGKAEEVFDKFLPRKAHNFRLKHKSMLSDEEDACFFRTLQRKNHRVPQFCMLIKFHKIDKNSNWKTRPVAGDCGSIMNELSLWFDLCMSVIAEIVTACIKDIRNLLDFIIKQGKISPASHLILEDSASVHANESE